MIKSPIMQDIVRIRLLLFLVGVITVPICTVLVILFAKGYRPDLKKGEIMVTGLLVAQSYPEGAQIFINNQLKSATNATINLPPGDYQIQIRKDGYHPWQKQLLVMPEIVTRATAVLFPSVPSLKPITTRGARLPLLSPDGTKVAYTSISGLQLYLLDLNESPLGLLNRESKIIADFNSFKITGFVWSPDSRQILSLSSSSASASSSAYLIDVFSQQLPRLVTDISPVIKEWKQNQTTREFQKTSTLPASLKELLATAAADLFWSPRENKLLYTATASAALPDQIIKPLPGSSTQPQERQLTPGFAYVYDLEEDRNFKIDSVKAPSPTPRPTKKTASVSGPAVSSKILLSNQHPSGWSWFPTSSHLYTVDGDKIIIKEYDNQNQTIVYAGPLANNLAIPYPSAKQMLILTNLDTTPASGSATSSGIINLYALSLR